MVFYQMSSICLCTFLKVLRWGGGGQHLLKSAFVKKYSMYLFGLVIAKVGYMLDSIVIVAIVVVTLRTFIFCSVQVKIFIKYRFFFLPALLYIFFVYSNCVVYSLLTTGNFILTKKRSSFWSFWPNYNFLRMKPNCSVISFPS